MHTVLIIALIILSPIFLYILAAVVVTIYLLKMSKGVTPVCETGNICVYRDSAYYRIVNLYYSIFGNNYERHHWDTEANLCPTTRKFFWGVMIYPFVKSYRKIVEAVTRPLNVDKKKFEKPILGVKIEPEEITPMNITLISVLSIIFIYLMANLSIAIYLTCKYGLTGMWTLPWWQKILGLATIIVYLWLIGKLLKYYEDNWKELVAKYPLIKTIGVILEIIGIIICAILLNLGEFFWAKLAKLAKKIGGIIAQAIKDLWEKIVDIFDPVVDFVRGINKVVSWKIPYDFEYRGKNVVWGKIEDAFIDDDIPAWFLVIVFVIFGLWVQGTISIITGIIYLAYEWETVPIIISAVINLLILYAVGFEIHGKIKGKKQVSLLMSWLRAKHDKICPPLKFVGEPRQEKF